MRTGTPLPRLLARREMRGRWSPSELAGPRFVAELSEAEAQGHVFLGFLSGGQVVVSLRCCLASAEPEPDGDLALAGGAVALRFWLARPAASRRLELCPLWERDVLEGSELLAQFQPRLLFYEFPHDARFFAFFVWDLVDRRGRAFWLVRLLAGLLPSPSCAACRRCAACPRHGLCSLTELRVKSDHCGDVRHCLRPLSSSSVLLLRPHKGLVTVANFGLLQLPPRGPPPILQVPSFAAPAKLHFGGCTEGVCSRCYQAWACSFRSSCASRLHEDLPDTAAACPLSQPAAKAGRAACAACSLTEQLALQPSCLDLVVNVSGLVDSHDRPDRAADGLTCPEIRTRLLAESYGHWLRRKCLLRPAAAALPPALLSAAPQQLTTCAPMPWLLQHSARCLSYASELCFPRATREAAPEEEVVDGDFDFYDLPLLSAGLHLPHTAPAAVFASALRPPPGPGPALRIEEAVLALRPLLHRRFRVAPFGPEPELRLLSASSRHVELWVAPWDWREGAGVRLLWSLASGEWRAASEQLRALPRAEPEVAVGGRAGANAAWLPDIGARRMLFFPDAVESAESLSELCDDSGLLRIRKSGNCEHLPE